MLRKLRARLAGWLRRPGEFPDDPYASVRQPLRRGPSSAAGAIALDEPAEPSRVWAFWRRAH